MTTHKIDKERRLGVLRRNALDALKYAGITEPPIALEELVIPFSNDITIAPHELDGVVDGLLRWNGERQKFFLYYRPDKYRQRFNLAHEISHYLIPEHCRAIRSRLGEHYSKSGFVSKWQMEVEADVHASELLIPEPFLQKNPEPCFSDVDVLVDIFKTSIASTCQRIIDICDAPAALIHSSNGVVTWGRANQHFKDECGDPYWKDQKVPYDSCTNKNSSTQTDLSGPIDAGKWIDGHHATLWEEVRQFSEFGYTLTFLSI